MPFHLLNQPAELLNRLRQRNGRAALDGTDGQAEIRSALLEEWEKDLGREGVFFAALKRNGLAESTLQTETFPITEREMGFNTQARQNPGYS